VPRVNLSRHLATIESYLEDYRTVYSDTDKDKEIRQSNRDKFQKYILTSCWMKMHSRAEHWISLGMIMTICDISENSVCAAAEVMKGTFVKNDQDLMDLLKVGLSNFSIQDIMEYDFDHMKDQYDIHSKNRGGPYEDLKYDKSSLYDTIMNASNHNDKEDGEAYYLYTPEIAVAFHRLLVSSLLSYVFRLRIVEEAAKALSKIPSPKLDPPSAVITVFIQLLLSTHLLFMISHSRLFRTHLKALGSLTLPNEAQAGIYVQQFTNVALWHTTCHEYDKSLVNRLKSIPQSSPESVQASAVKDSAVEESTTEESAVKASITEESDAEVTEEILDRDLDPESGVTVDVLYRRWIMGMVDHFASIRVLERVCRKLPPKGKINYSILGLNRPSLSSGTWDVMVNEIKTLCQDSSLVSQALKKPPPHNLADEAIRIIKTKIEEYEEQVTVKKSSMRFERTVYGFFKKLLSKSPNPLKACFSGCGHCEAILMAIIYRISNENDLDFSLKACSP
jgi:hypothetical protein